MSGLTDEQLARLRCVAGQYGRLQIRLGGPHGEETRPVIPSDDIVAALAERDALRERVARLEAIETAARALYQAQVEGGWPNDQDAEHDALGVALGEQEVSASDATE